MKRREAKCSRGCVGGKLYGPPRTVTVRVRGNIAESTTTREVTNCPCGGAR